MEPPRPAKSAIASTSASGNFDALVDAMADFAGRGGSIELTFGADSFGVDIQGTERAAVELLLERFKDLPTAKVFLYHQTGRTFHPKLYLFSNEENGRALLIVGSSNWSYGGLVANIEADLLVRLNLDDPQHRECYESVVACFDEYWQENT